VPGFVESRLHERVHWVAGELGSTAMARHHNNFGNPGGAP
jgi:hypothetical protein